jgi:broad specificity phosphatase PhoE
MTTVEIGSGRATTTVYLVRHAAHELVDHVLVGRNAAVTLSAAGFAQARALGRYFAGKEVAAVQTSPQPRARQTADAIALSAGLSAEIACNLNELDVGEWTSRSFAELESDPRWRAWNERRASACPPGGESMAAIRRRMLGHLDDMRARYPNGSLVMVSHAEPIRAVILHYLTLSPDEFMSVRIDPACVTTILLRPGAGMIVRSNECMDALLAA